MEPLQPGGWISAAAMPPRRVRSAGRPRATSARSPSKATRASHSIRCRRRNCRAASSRRANSPSCSVIVDADIRLNLKSLAAQATRRAASTGARLVHLRGLTGWTMEAAAAPKRFRLGEWQVDSTLDEIRTGERVVKLEPRTMRLLCVLAERPGEVWSADELLARVWPGVMVTQSSVYQAIAQLRRELGDDGDEARYIATVPRRGYRLVAAVET